MKIILKGKNLEVTPSLQEFTEKKLSDLKKYINILREDQNPDLSAKTLAEVFVEVGKETRHHRKGDVFFADAQLQLPGKLIAAKTNSDDLNKAIIELRDEMKREIEKYKVKKIDSVRREQRKSKREIDL